ncbi:uncharacterized protein LOC106776620 isoform X2 [Vigna radiata var. radiata]|uniref:Uncharacterized protein LOC106776620 isoform X2 n=1 Tax=Vigna radiata var. radiata TaxID=3916 RepID=A0A3Q0EN96_VIGRR|nr:uncharacterized protein LOC106776620 isoform X2 [Vigna radiata var. radiata]
MENKKEEHKLAFVCKQESHTNDETQSKRHNAQPNVIVVPSAKISSSSPSLENTPNSNQQQQASIVQRPYNAQSASEQLSAMDFPSQASAAGALNQWHQYPHLFAQSASPFWQSHPPSAVAGPSLGANVPTIYHPFTDTGFPAAPSSTTQTPPPSYWGPSSYMAQLYQMQHPYVHSFPDALNFSSATPKVPNCSASAENYSQIGNIKSPSELTQKYQQLWEAEKAKNVELRRVTHKLRAKVSGYKDKLKKLKKEVSSFKQKTELAFKQVNGTVPAGPTQPLKKRGRPNLSLASVDALNESYLLAGGKRPSMCNSLSQNKSPFEKVKPIFEKVILKKVENKEITTRFTTKMAQQENNVNSLNTGKDVSCNIQINQIYPIKSASQGHVHQESEGVQTWGSRVHVNFGKGKDLGSSEVLNHDKSVSSKKYIGNTGLNAGKHLEDDVMDVSDDIFIQRGQNIAPGWSLRLAEEDDVSEYIEGSAKDENEAMGDDTSSAEEIGVTKELGGWLPHG